MVYLILGGVAKLLFNLLFVGGFSMGVKGTALATLLLFFFPTLCNHAKTAAQVQDT